MYSGLKSDFSKWYDRSSAAAVLLSKNSCGTISILAYNRAFIEKILKSIGIMPKAEVKDISGPLMSGETEDILRYICVMPEDVDGILLKARRFLEGNGPSESEVRLKKVDESELWMNVQLSWITEGEYFIALISDITARKEAEAREVRLRNLLEKILATTKTAIFWKDADRRFLGANRAFLEYYDFPSVDSIIGKTDEDMGWHPNPDPYMNDEIQVIRDGISTNRVPGVCISHRDERNIVASKAPMYDNGEIIGLVGSFEDVTNEVRQKKEIEELNAELERSLEAEREANRAKSDFLARMSHDMRTPLTTVIGLCDIAEDRFEDAGIQDYFVNIKDSSEYLLSILSDILDMQNLISQNIILNPVICTGSETARTVEAIIRTQAEAKDITFVTSFNCSRVKCYPKADTRRVQQIIMNLLSNAVKYTDPGGRIDWNVDVKYETPEKVVVVHKISDNGHGMSKEFQMKMYEPFSQEKKTADASGSGLGLAIVKKMLDIMGGTIDCDSAPGKGTQFTVTIPHEAADNTEIEKYFNAKSILADNHVLAGCRVLVCEDNSINAKIIARLLEAENISADIASDGQQAAEMACNSDYDAILMDIRMPVMNGYEATREIRKTDTKTPIIALSANIFPEDIAKSIESGMNAHLAKPVDKKRLFSLLEELIRRN